MCDTMASQVQAHHSQQQTQKQTMSRPLNNATHGTYCTECTQMLTRPAGILKLLTSGYIHNHLIWPEDDPSSTTVTNNCSICNTIKTSTTFMNSSQQFQRLSICTDPPPRYYLPRLDTTHLVERAQNPCWYRGIRFMGITHSSSGVENPFLNRKRSIDGSTKWLESDEVIRFLTQYDLDIIGVAAYRGEEEIARVRFGTQGRSSVDMTQAVKKESWVASSGDMDDDCQFKIGYSMIDASLTRIKSRGEEQLWS